MTRYSTCCWSCEQIHGKSRKATLGGSEVDLRYVRGTTDFGLWFTRGSEFKVEGYCDADYATDRDRSRSVTGYLFQVGGNTISWRSGIQPIVALSTTESEYMSLNESAKEALWLKGVCEDLEFDQGAVKINCDSQSAIFLAKKVAITKELSKYTLSSIS